MQHFQAKYNKDVKESPNEHFDCGSIGGNTNTGQDLSVDHKSPLIMSTIFPMGGSSAIGHGDDASEYSKYSRELWMHEGTS